MNKIRNNKKHWVTYQNHEININELQNITLFNHFFKGFMVKFVFNNGNVLKAKLDFKALINFKEELRK